MTFVSVSISKSKRLSAAGKTVTGSVVGPGSYSQVALFSSKAPGVSSFSKMPDTRAKEYVEPMLK